MLHFLVLLELVLGSWDIDASKFDSIVAIPDLHGDLPNAVRSLFLAFKKVNPWHPFGLDEFIEFVADGMEQLPVTPLDSVSRTLLVQLGDLADRGPHSKKLYLLFNHIEDLIGWKCAKVLGNHDLAPHLRVKSYKQLVHEDDLESFGGVDGRNMAFSGLQNSIWTRYIQDKFGIFVRVASLSNDSATVNTLFVHGGVSLPWLAGIELRGFSHRFGTVISVDELNSFLWTFIKSESPESSAALLFSPGSPLVNRDFNSREEDYIKEKKWCDSVVNELLQLFSVSRIIVGHSAQRRPQIRSRCGGRILLVDVRISLFAGGGGNPFALMMKLDGDNLSEMISLFEGREEAHDCREQLDDDTFDAGYNIPVCSVS